MMRRVVIPLMLGVFAATGCIRPTVTPTIRYVLKPEIAVAQASPTERSLGIRRFRASALYRTPILYAQDHQIHPYPYAEWALNPEDMVTRAITDAIVATGRFRDAGDASNVNRPELMLVGELRRFEADRDASPVVAVCEVRIELREAFGTGLLWADTLVARVPLAEDRVDALPDAMSLAVAQIANKAATEIAAH
ncbi:MAG TPA: ABC-type transport auxiliary lipoprotein family protein [Candidatus Hydrogenedentes bacterium]|jgi:ABC-type uncharacterized transport system auxiliary subunit|nr:ABC-type transport auxiliary lipoprotein family protein [Candidatus Hydrogenedentota bacterium]